MYHNQLKSFKGKKVVEFDPEMNSALDCANMVYRISATADVSTWEAKDTVEECLKKYLAMAGASETESIIFGAYDVEYSECSPEIFRILVEEKSKLPKLKSAFFGDTLYEEAMLSCIFQDDFTGFFEAYPGLQYCHIRSGDGLMIRPFRHVSLETLVLETAGMNKKILSQLTECVLPELTHLELWMGNDDYGWNGRIEDIQPFFDSSLFPKLIYLGIKCSQIADQVAEAVAESSILNQLKELDLSGGLMSDAGAEKLLASSRISRLENLNLEENYLSDELEKLFKNLSNVQVNFGDQKQDEGWGRYVSVAE